VLRPAVVLPGRLPAGTAGDDGAVAVLVPPGDVDRLIEGIELLAGDRALRDALGRNARHLALSRYTWRHHVAAILAGLDRVGLRAREWGARSGEVTAADAEVLLGAVCAVVALLYAYLAVSRAPHHVRLPLTVFITFYVLTTAIGATLLSVPLIRICGRLRFRRWMRAGLPPRSRGATGSWCGPR